MPSRQDGSNSTPKSDEDLQKATVGERKPRNAPITPHEYDSRWPELFEREALCTWQHGLASGTFGSTSVPGLCTKPIIDILLVVTDAADETTYVSDLEEAGYTLRIREPEWLEHRMFKGPDTDINSHVFSKGVFEVQRMLGFRDWLRANASDQDQYASVKRRLSQRE
ncbi:GrpB family protein [Lentibacillus jeotgali]|uniref:GrpB family protein n=1 Tax=Lentibacillus jeotgali TaxID=558169 RepID=UPI0002627849|nr:GrpB family protein [Lentibacillus jeotgali]